MPVRWTPENDRILLLKLIETHAISVNYNLIASAWPAGGEKPTSKALSEHFAKLRKLAGIPLAKGGRGRSTLGSAPRTPTSSAKKRKINKKATSDDESDADEHFTPSDESSAPTPTPKSRKISSARNPKTPRFGDRFANDVPAGFASGSPGMRAKKEAVEDPFETNDFADSLSGASTLRARVNGHSFEHSNFGFNQYGVTTPGGSGHGSSQSHSENGMDSAQGPMSFYTFGGATGISSHVDMGMEHHADQMTNFNGNHMGDFDGLGIGNGGSYDMASMPTSFANTMSIDNMSFPTEHEVPTPSKELAAEAARLNLDAANPFNHRGQMLPVCQKPNSRLHINPKPASATRNGKASNVQSLIKQEVERMQRTPRGASKSAKESISQRLQVQKQLDLENGEKSSDEVSATSEFQGDDDDDEYV